MSRIQEILAKAERDGTARRTQTTESFPPAAPVEFPPQPSSSVGPAQGHSTTSGQAPTGSGQASSTGPGQAPRPRVDGSSALDPFAPMALGPASPASIGPTPSIAAVASQAVPIGEPRTALATLHPLLVAAINPHSPVAEQYRTLRSRISHREEMTPLRTLVITSPGAGDGKSTTAANLALTMAQEFQRRVVLVDADFRGSSVHSLFGVSGSPGLAELLMGEASLDDVMVYMPDYRLTIIPAGQTPQYPTELLGSTAMRRAIDVLRSRFDRVLFDMPAVTPLADVGTLTPMADGVLMVVRAGLTLRPALDEALAAFGDGKVVGVVLNDAR
jgi:capsular exopolysaccharide synthesis family protein